MTGGLRLHQVLHRFTFPVTHVTQIPVVLEQITVHTTLAAPAPTTPVPTTHVARVQTIAHIAQLVEPVLIPVLLIHVAQVLTTRVLLMPAAQVLTIA